MKEIKYAESVPQVIRDLMGNDSERWPFIYNYDTVQWFSPQLRSAPTLRTTRTEEIYFSDFTTKELLEKLQEVHNDPDYVSSEIDIDGEKYSTINVVYKYHPTWSEKKQYKDNLLGYNECVKQHEKLLKKIKGMFEMYHTKSEKKAPETLDSLNKELEQVKKRIKAFLEV